jgi:hypothetical protein
MKHILAMGIGFSHKMRAASWIVLGIFAFAASPALADQIPPGWTTSNIEVIGFSGLNGRELLRLFPSMPRTVTGIYTPGTP